MLGSGSGPRDCSTVHTNILIESSNLPFVKRVSTQLPEIWLRNSHRPSHNWRKPLYTASYTLKDTFCIHSVVGLACFQWHLPFPSPSPAPSSCHWLRCDSLIMFHRLHAVDVKDHTTARVSPISAPLRAPDWLALLMVGFPCAGNAFPWQAASH